ncbi:MAG: SRPBCC family protein [Candidatus Levyibacteriota bacterium]
MEDKKIVIERVFDAPKDMVWKAWTDADMVKKWWGPKMFYAPSIKIDFKVGGKYIYAMHGPAGTQFDKDMYSAGVYKEIVPMEKIVVSDYFSDENSEKISAAQMGMPEDMPDEMDVTVTFEEIDSNKTKLSIIYSPKSQEQYEAMLKSGMQEGWGTSLDKLADALKE